MAPGAVPPIPLPVAAAAVVAVGAELLAPGRADRNTPALKRFLAEFGVPVVFTAVVGDDEEALTAALAHALEQAPLVFAAGGLGPTSDDRTRFAAARVLEVTLREHRPSLEAIRRRYSSRGQPMPPVNRRQALIPEGAEALPNPAGTAPGVLAGAGRRALVLLPGPPRELAALFEAEVRPRLLIAAGGAASRTAETVLVAGLSESELQERILDLVPDAGGPEELAILAHGGEVEVQVSGPAEAGNRVRRRADRIAARLGSAVFSRTPGEHLEHAVGRLLRARGERIAVAESLTGGGIAGRVTAVPGSSEWFDLGVTTYADTAKESLLGVGRGTLRSVGAVSRETAAAMADGVRRRAERDVGSPAGKTWGVAVTGIAGPGGGSAAKPVGLVWIALAGPARTVRRFHFPGDRDLVRRLTSAAALNLLRRTILAEGTAEPGVGSLAFEPPDG